MSIDVPEKPKLKRGRNGRSYIWGYARQSRTDSANVPSTVLQTQICKVAAEEIAATTEATWRECLCEDNTSSLKVPWTERVVFRALLDRMNPGDHLVVWKLDRLERNPVQLQVLYSLLQDNHISVYPVHELGGHRMALEDPMAQIQFGTYTQFKAAENANFSRTMAEVKQAAFESGRVYTHTPPLGMRRRYETIRAANGVPQGAKKWDEWYEPVCRLIREIKARVDAGETVWAVGRDFRVRGEKYDAKGMSWETTCIRRKPRSAYDVAKKRYHYGRLYFALKAYRECLSRGFDIGPDNGDAQALTGLPVISNAAWTALLRELRTGTTESPTLKKLRERETRMWRL